MTTSPFRSFLFPALMVTTLSACGSSVAEPGSGASGGTGEPDPGPTPTHVHTAYPGTGFIVHEWGTNTVVVGSDGSLQRGLHHEEEDLPGFVYDRIKAGSLPGTNSVEVKMETPVTYFYSDKPRTVSASVAFPHGVFTQWYPAVQAFTPHIASPTGQPSGSGFADPYLDPDYPFGSPQCKKDYTQLLNGNLDWGQIELLPREVAPSEADVPKAPLTDYTWSYARNVAANRLRVTGAPGAEQGQLEHFLFYRGLGNFELPVEIQAKGKGKVALHNGYGEAVPRVFAIQVGGGKGAFTSFADGVLPSSTLDVDIPSMVGAKDTEAYAEALGESVTSALDDTGLYHDEALAMVNTWKRQWFGTPGTRLLYLIPQSWTEGSIPLHLDPQPDKLVRVMMIRVELITPEIEAADVEMANQPGKGDLSPNAKSYFLSLGRFAEPRLRRALSLIGNPSYGDAFLASVATVETHVGTGE
ncbi:MAG: hypothetical protein ABI193_05770 [Minicystis sp.]